MERQMSVITTYADGLDSRTATEEDILRARRLRQRELAAITIVFLNVVDVLVTQHILRTHPASREGNSVLVGLIMSPWIWLPKAGIPLLVVFSTARSPLTRINYQGMVAVWAIYWAVILWNLHILFR
jgi:hypothetical protein